MSWLRTPLEQWIYSQFSPVMIYLFSPDGTITTDSEFAQSQYSWYYTPSITVSCHFGILIFHAEILNVSRLNPHLCRIHNHLNMEVSKVMGAPPVIIQVINDHDSALKQPGFFAIILHDLRTPPISFVPTVTRHVFNAQVTVSWSWGWTQCPPCRCTAA